MILALFIKLISLTLSDSDYLCRHLRTILTYVGVIYNLSLVVLLTFIPCLDGHGDDFLSPDALVIIGQFGHSDCDLLVLDDALLRLIV